MTGAAARRIATRALGLAAVLGAGLLAALGPAAGAPGAAAPGGAPFDKSGIADWTTPPTPGPSRCSRRPRSSAASSRTASRCS
jgi:hypothetical protein